MHFLRINTHATIYSFIREHQRRTQIVRKCFAIIVQTKEVGCLMSKMIWKPFWMKKNVNNNVCEVRSLCMEGIFEKYFWVHVPLAVVIKTL